MGQVIKFPVASRRADVRRVRHLDEVLRDLSEALPENADKTELDERTVSLIGRACELGGVNQVAKLMREVFDPSVEPEKPELTREDQATAMGYSRGRGIKGSAYEETKSLSTTEIAKLIRKDIKEAKKAGKLPKKLKVSVRTRNYSGGSSIDVQVKSSPVDILNRERLRYEAEHPHERPMSADDPEFPIYTEEGEAIMDLLKGFHAVYNRDNSDTMTDYFDVRYYGSVGLDWKYRNEIVDSVKESL
jgi:hypothetical protein